MGTPFMIRLRPTKLDGYKPKLPHNQQPSHIPRAFKDAMSVREAVFVREQGHPLEHEFDADDARSCHWVIYASVNATMQPEERDPRTGAVIRPRRSVSYSLPIGTLRIVPFPHPPHPPHPPDGARYVGGILRSIDAHLLRDRGASEDGTRSNDRPRHDSTRATGTIPPPAGEPPWYRGHRAINIADERRPSAPMPFGTDRRTNLHDGKEPYVKLGKLAVLPAYRGYDIAAQLWRTARLWLRYNPSYFDPSLNGLGLGVMRVDNVRDVPRWNGLVCVHALAREGTIRFYEGWGFQVDWSMGTFYYENMPHLAMWIRLEIVRNDFIPLPTLPGYRLVRHR